MAYIQKNKLNKSAFGDQVVVQMTPKIQYSFEYDIVNNTRLFTDVETNGGAVTTSAAMAVCDTSTTANSVASLESVRPAKYNSGFGARARFTTLFSAPATSCTQLVGIFDETGSTAKFKNGYGIGYNGTTLQLKHFLNDSDVSVTYTNPSGFTLDPTKLNIWQIDYAYLGIGDIIFSVYDTAKKDFVEVHRIQKANAQTVPHSYNPNYKLWMYADNGATTSQVSVKSASMSYFILGNVKQSQTQVYSLGYNATLSSVTTQSQLFSIRNKTTYTSATNFIDILLEGFSAQFEATANARGICKVVLNPTLGGSPSWSDLSATDSIVEVDTAQTTVSSEGVLLAVAYLAGSLDRENLIDLVDESILIRPGDEIAVLVESTNPATFTAFLSWHELF